MKKVLSIFLLTGLLVFLYNLKLIYYPYDRIAYYTNEECAEAYVFENKQIDIVFVGSSLSGTFDGRNPVGDGFFNLSMPGSGACTGVEIVRRSNKIPKQLFIEINHLDRGIDSIFIQKIFEDNFYSLKKYFPILQERNKFLVNLIDMDRSGNNGNINRPPSELYNNLLGDAQNYWSEFPDSSKFEFNFNRLSHSLDYFSDRGCEIVFFEISMDSSLTNSNLLSFQRSEVLRLVKEKGYSFVPADTSRSYSTGDGVHLLRNDREIYVDYFHDYLKSR